MFRSMILLAMSLLEQATLALHSDSEPSCQLASLSNFVTNMLEEFCMSHAYSLECGLCFANATSCTNLQNVKVHVL